MLRRPQICDAPIALASFLIAVLAGSLAASNHAVHIVEVMAGANGNSNVQFIVIQQDASGENLWGPQGGETQSRTMLVFYDRLGRETGIYKFAANPPTGGTFKTLIATPDFAGLPGAPTPDIIIPPLLNALGGKVCFRGNPASLVPGPRTECLSYGAFTGDTEINSGSALPPTAAGPPAPALPITNTVSLRRTNNTGQNSDFVLVNAPTPTNIAGQTVAIPVASQVAQGKNLFDLETFQGNGRTCAACHVAELSLGLTPANIQSRFAKLSELFDPQFIAETAPSAFDAGFDFNLNTMTLVAAVASDAPCTGELRGIITGSGGGRAKVLARTSPTTYLIYGGRSPILSGTVSDTGSCAATVASVAAGSLGAVPGGPSGIEDPKRMRSSASADFPQGRALILENVDGIGPPLTQAVFRKSPHLLNLNFTAPFGFSGDVTSLQTFSTNAVIQHFPRSLARSSSGANPDFRLPTTAEAAAMEAFMRAQDFPPGATADTTRLDLNKFVTTPAQVRGRNAFFGPAKCSFCHANQVLSLGLSINTGVVNQTINTAAVDGLPKERNGTRQFSVPQLFNIRHLGPFFHDGSAPTLRKAVEFYTTPAFTASEGGLITLGGITMTPGTIDDIVAFLESLSLGSIVPSSPQSMRLPPDSLSTPSVQVLDIDGKPAAGVTVRFAITGGAGTLTGAVQTTDSSGIATVGSWQLAPGQNALTATPTSRPGLQFASTPAIFSVVSVPNDDFANRGTLFGTAVTTTGSIAGFAAESDEPGDLLSGGGTTPSAWWTWTAPCSFTLTQPTPFIDTIGSDFDTVLAVYTGSSLSSLTLVASDHDSGGGGTSRVPSPSPGPGTLRVTAGTVFQIRVRGATPAATGHVTLHINAICSGTSLLLSASAMNFTTVNDDGTLRGTTPPQSMTLVETGATVGWTATANQPWITVSPPAGTGSATITIAMNAAARVFPPGFFGTGTVTVNAPGATSVPSTLVTLTVLSASQNTPPVGAFDTPADGQTGVTGSIAVSGWALDDIGVTRVRITRDPIDPEPPGVQVFIGDAAFVSGARPDVAAVNPGKPLKDRAGWGYLLLTNFLPGRGNGTFTLHAIAEDADGHSIELGTKTITCTNDMAVLPFGAIDTPAQGQTVDPATLLNFGWVLARTPALASPPSGAVTVLVDGVPVGSPTGWTSRADLTALFPADTYPGVTNALGVFSMAGLPLSDGVHTLAWLVTDNNGKTEGVGSRFFTVANGTALMSGARTGPVAGLGADEDGKVLEGPPLTPPIGAVWSAPRVALAEAVNGAPLDSRDIRGRRGFDLDAPFDTLTVGETGRATLYGEELDRFELHFRNGDASTSERYSGYLRVGAELSSLPIGSRLEEASGIFTWSAGPGFLRDYDLVFVRWEAGRAAARQEVRIVIKPQSRNRVGPQVAIDSPQAGSEIDGTFIVAGWAIDPDSSIDTGVNTLHVWAYPTASPDRPIFLGAAAYGGKRPDVSAIHGDRFERSGYAITVDMLPPGTYDIAVFAWSTATGGFVPAKVVRVNRRE